MQPLHDKQHRYAGAVSIGVIDHRAVQVDQPLMFGQRPEETHTPKERGGKTYFSYKIIKGLLLTPVHLLLLILLLS